jgi:hypothetical protein
MPPIDWDGVVRKVAGVAVSVGKRVVESGVDAALEDLDRALLEGRRRVKKARSRIPKAPPAKEAPEEVVIEATLEEDK